MTASILSTLSPCVLNATTLPVQDFDFSPAIARDAFRHSGNRFGSVLVKPGAAPIVMFKAPFLAAYTLLGFSLLKLTTFKFTFARFTDGGKSTSTDHSAYSLAAGAAAYARMVGASVNQRGILMADIAVLPLSSDGMIHPLSRSDLALPTVGTEPTLHTLGPIEANGTRISGCRNQGLDLGNEFVGEPNDGDLYLRTMAEMEGNPILQGEHADPLTMLQSLGLFGLTISANVVLYFRAIHAASGAALGTGVSLTIASGSIDPGPVRMRRNSVPSLGFSCQPLSASNTHPVVVNTGATIPAG